MMAITHNDNFSTFGWTGDGSASTPYTLEDQSYTHYVGIGYFISIVGTTANFTIKNCNFSGNSDYFSVYMNSVINGVVTGCIFDTAYASVGIMHSTGIQVTHNKIMNVSYGGYFMNSPFSNFSHNIVDTFSSNGVYIETGSTNSIIHDNEITNGSAGYGIQVLGLGSNVTYNILSSIDGTGVYAHANYLNISHNNICNITGKGVNTYQSHYCKIEFNEIHRTHEDGMFLDSSSELLVANNTISLSNRSGINSDSSDSAITHNVIFACADYGIFLNSSSSYIDPTYNYIGWNGQNARDDGYQNDWNANYWSDYVSGPNYGIPGSGGDNDLNPVTLTDTTAPIISDETDVHYFETITGNYINWSISDDYPRFWALELDEVEVDSGWWCNDLVNHYVDIDGHSPGTYNYTFIVEDANGTSSSDEVIVTVEPYDYDAPLIEGFSDQFIEAGVDGITLHWNATDLHPEKYILYQNGASIDEGVYTNAGNITFSLATQVVSSFNFTCWFNDTLGNSAIDTVWVHFVDTTDPVLNSPADIIYTVGDTGNTITWTGTESYASTYSVYINGTLNTTGSWDGSNIVFSVDGYDVGGYNLTLLVEDESGNIAVDTVLVTVEDVATTTTTTTTTTTETTSTGTGATDTTTPPANDGMVMVITLAIGIGGAAVIVVIIVFLKMKK
ncbi:MAG: right-handed parallel beta-helix repeat-containing protein [Candidatus Thorarchaeota archaeon]